MKKIKLLLIFVFFTTFSVFSLDMDFSAQADNFAFLDNGTILKKMPDIGFELDLSSRITNLVQASFKIQRTPVIGNLLKPRVIFSSSGVSFSFGPSLGIFNKTYGQKELSTSFQPGFGVGMKILTNKGFLLLFDVDFSIFTGFSEKKFYINNGLLETGIRIPCVFMSAKVEQLTRTSTMNATTISSLTDASLNFEIFAKPSRFVFPLSCILRLSTYKNVADTNLNKKFMSIVLKFGFVHNIYTDLSYYIDGELPVYNIKRSGEIPPEFRYKVRAGFKISFY